MYLFLYSMQRSLQFILPSLSRQDIYLWRRYHSRNQLKTPFILNYSALPDVNNFFRSPKLITTSFSTGSINFMRFSQATPRFSQRLLSIFWQFFESISRMQHLTTLMVMFFWQSSFRCFFSVRRSPSRSSSRQAPNYPSRSSSGQLVLTGSRSLSGVSCASWRYLSSSGLRQSTKVGSKFVLYASIDEK